MVCSWRAASGVGTMRPRQPQELKSWVYVGRVRGTTATFNRCYSASHTERKGGVCPLPPLHSPAISLPPSSPLYSHGTEKMKGRERERRSRWSSPGAAITATVAHRESFAGREHVRLYR
nr:hypothetical protein Iba_chr14bCG7080 [Ipomoea batatas]